MIIAGKIDVTKILKDRMFRSQKGAVYLDITLMTNRTGKDQYGNDGIVTQDLGKEARVKKEKGPILGNFRIIYADSPPTEREAKPAKSWTKKPEPKDDEAADLNKKPEEDDVPF